MVKAFRRFPGQNSYAERLIGLNRWKSSDGSLASIGDGCGKTDRRREWHRQAVDHLITMWGTLSEALKVRSWFGRNSQIEFEEGY
jgi:hypothetical protein